LVAISFVSGKGGTGKTTVALNLGAAMASMGRRVMLVDADMLTHSLSILCHLEEEKGLTDLFTNSDLPIKNTVFDVLGVPNLQVIPSSISFGLLARMSRLLNGKKSFVARRMSEISRSAEYVLIDAPAGVSREVFFAASMGDRYCLVAEAGPADLEGALVFNVFARRIGLDSIGIIFNRARTAPPESLKTLCKDIFGQVVGTIPFDIRFVEAFEERSIFYQRYPEAPASRSIEQIARALERLGRYDEALPSLDRTIELKPDNANAWNNKGVTLERLGRYNEALLCFDRTIELKPDNANAWNNKGVTLTRLNMVKEAESCFAKANEINPKRAHDSETALVL